LAVAIGSRSVTSIVNPWGKSVSVVRVATVGKPETALRRSPSRTWSVVMSSAARTRAAEIRSWFAVNPVTSTSSIANSEELRRKTR
jgi:hypothetical protein